MNPRLFRVNRQSWPTRVDMHQDIEDSLAASSISHAGGPQSPARSAENLLNGHRSKGLLDLGRREETTVTDSPGPLTQARLCPSRSSDDWGGRSDTWINTNRVFLSSDFTGKLCSHLGPRCRCGVGERQGGHALHLSRSQTADLPLQVPASPMSLSALSK